VVVDLLAVVARSVTVAWPLALLTAEAAESVAPEVLKLTVIPLSGLPPSVTVVVIVVVVAPSAGIDAGDAVSDTASARNESAGRIVLEAQVRHEFFPLREGIGQIVGKKERSGSGRSPGIRAPERSGRHPIVEKMARIRRQSTTATAAAMSEARPSASGPPVMEVPPPL